MSTKMTTLRKLVLATALAYAPMASAFIVTGQLTGDIRTANPDNLFVDVTVDVTGNTAAWTIDINSPDHQSVKLHEFLFNLTGDASNYQFSGFNPTGWAISSPGTTQGAGGATFLFEALDPAGPPNAPDVTNIVNLTFTMTYSLGNLTLANFLDAPIALANDAGSGQMGVHLQSLTALPGESDSGFAFGNYVGGTLPPVVIPEPGSLVLLGLGLAGLGMIRRRRL